MHHVFTQDNHRVFELFVDIKKAGKKNPDQSGDSAQCKALQVCEGSFILETRLLFHSFSQL